MGKINTYYKEALHRAKRRKSHWKLLLMLLGVCCIAAVQRCLGDAPVQKTKIELAKLPAFPGAEGYGKYTVGGRGGKVYTVTNLNDSGEGSLRAAVEASGPRTVVLFRVSGTIALESRLKISNPYITIAGQTAPGDGVCLKGSLTIDADNVIIRYIRVRANPAVGEVDAIFGRHHKNIILDHVSASWSSDEVFSLYRNDNITIQWCMITEACAKFKNGENTGHRFGGIWGNNYGTYHHNLFAHNDSRNPRWASGAKYNDYRNNVIYNWGYNSCYGGEALEDSDPDLNFFTVNMVANYYKAGPATRSNVKRRIAEPGGNEGGVGSWYVADNYVDGFPDVTADNWLGIDETKHNKMSQPWDAMPISQQSPQDAYDAVLAHAGCSLPNRDTIDTRIIEEVRNGTATYGNNGIITTPSDVGGWPELKSLPAPVDSDSDGMPDAWEKERGLNPSDASDGPQDRNGGGYTNVEEYINGLVTSGAFQAAVHGFSGDVPARNTGSGEKPRVIATTDGEIDDQCSMVRFLLYANEWDIEGIVTSSSQYHWHGHKWAGDDWVQPYLDAYAKVYPNLVKHDSRYPAPQYLQERTLLGNVETEGEMDAVTTGSQHIVKVLLDESDDRPVWLQAWGGPNTIARALKTIEEEHPEEMAYVANKIRFFFIWEQDSTYQDYIRPHWGKYNIPTIISDQFEAIAYRWAKVQPEEKQKYFTGAWMKENFLENHGPLCALYKAKENGDFRSEGDSPAFLHTIVTGLRNLESPDWGGWGGRYVKVRENTWLDPVPDSAYKYPEGRWYTNSAWGRNSLRKGSTKTEEQRREYFKPMWRWTDALQNDFAARADWCVKSYEEANHPPKVVLGHTADMEKQPGAAVKLSAKGTSDPDKDKLKYHWWQYLEAGSCDGTIEIRDAGKQDASFTVPGDAGKGETIHIICEVTDTGKPPLTRYQRVIVTVRSQK